MSKPHHDQAHAVIDLLAASVEPGPTVTDPGAWRKAVRNRLRSEHWRTLMALLDPSAPSADRTATIVALLQTERTTPAATAPPAIPEWTPPDSTNSLDTASARDRIAAIRGQLAEQTR